MTNILIQKYIWLVQTFMKAGFGGMDLQEIQQRWEERWGEVYTRRSFCNHRDHIRDIFGINIGCRRSDNIYFIDYDSNSDESGTSIKWIVDSVAMQNIAELSEGRLKGRIALETIPSGKEKLLDIIAAMEDNLCIEIGYRKYSSSSTSAYTIYPYAVKESVKRWYLVGYCEQRNAVRVYSLDRIVSLQTSDRHFEMPDRFDVDALFEDCYGVYLPDEGSARQKVVLRLSPQEAHYADDLPLHTSQRKLSTDGDGYATYSIRIHPNRQFLLDILSKGSGVEVLEPAELREQVRNELIKSIKLYE